MKSKTMDLDNSIDGIVSSEEITSTTSLKEAKTSLSSIGGDVENEVFLNPLLLDEILKHLIFNQGTKISRKMIKIIRLVQKGWLEATSNLLKRSHQPVILLKLTGKNSFNESNKVKTNGKSLDRFVSTFGNSTSLQYSLLPFKLDLSIEYFRQENQQSLSDCFTKLGDELIEIEVTFPTDGGSMPFTFPEFSLPFLRKLKFKFSDEVFLKRRTDQNVPCFHSNTNGPGLLQIIFNTSERINELAFQCCGDNSGLIPFNFKFLKLPDSVQSLEVDSKFLGGNTFFKNQLPYLKRLAIKLPKLPLENDTLFKILYRFRKTLTEFLLVGSEMIGQVATTLKFPIMEKLEIIKFHCTKCEFENDDYLCLQPMLPKLKSVCWIKQNEALLAKWSQESKFEFVDSLTICLVNDEFLPVHPNYFQSISLEMIQQNMIQLKSLKIISQGKFRNRHKNLLDSILLGIPAQLIAALSDWSAFVRSVEFERDIESSIINLSELTQLTLCVTEFPYTKLRVPIENRRAFPISDLLFEEAFLKMPKLRKLSLEGSIQASSKITDEWKRYGRAIKCVSPGLPHDSLN